MDNLILILLLKVVVTRNRITVSHERHLSSFIIDTFLHLSLLAHYVYQQILLLAEIIPRTKEFFIGPYHSQQ